ncbi:mucoidy inhibitor MuiA family protein [Mucilaginibacter sp. BT774]|uniref:mucoidy inhibitor MuiA family protein n=1 Tax=Mucilaginibacter sp. BT774 TaxID=3062276 RepID=UPI002676C490|nr:mucoidy inhibitor MuiA family protein [Mucilaginibacter sp. BT774]MDO3626015.1 mucoidy inhibitor MuiA family protein [Mucilaginibacter sp. BT774]
MFRKLLVAASLFFITIVAQADDQKIESKVQKVVVFLNGAQVTRMAMVHINPGNSTLIFENISPGIDVQSIHVRANGDFTILSVKHELNFLNEQIKQQRIEDLRAKQKSIKDKIDLQTSLASIYQEEENMLVKNQMIAGQNTGLDIIKLKQALDFQTERLTALKKKEQENTAQIADLTKELLKYSQQIAELNKGASTATSNILVTVSSKTSLQTEFTLSYVVHNASWFPTYDVRAKNVNSPISISYKANVSQQSGEDWKNIKLTLSTGNPTVAGNKPELNPYFLNFGMYYQPENGTMTAASGKVIGSDDGKPIPGASIRVKGSSVGTVSDANGNFTVQLPPNSHNLEIAFIGYIPQTLPITSSLLNVSLKPSASNLNEVVVVGYGTSSNGYDTEYKRDLTGSVAGVQIRGMATIPIGVNKVENQTNIEFNIAMPYSVPSDGKQYTVEINQLDIPAIYQYAVAPKLSTDVFLTARLTDWNKYNLLSGEANLFFEGTFIGKSLINTDATTDTLNLSLGTDKNIVVTRTSLKDLSERQSLGSNKKETRDWQIEVKNRKRQPINLLVEDQVPVSQNSSIEVEIQELSGAALDKLTGKATWKMTLKPEDDKKIELKYLVKYPKNQSVIIQ